ncbi:MAG TPA: protein phosphatase 2C domain-containing protein [Blastocatellia bacterium]|jgi:protein phosphatase|nr:protein phosphatase 2C domain-containing protein [Blastocatellia bacterium]
MKITVGQITDKGLNPKRLSNEDNLLAMPDRGIFLVADGVGGRLGGAVASQTAVDIFSKVFTQQHQDDLRKIVESTIDFCNQKIYEDARSDPGLGGMATTIAMLAVEGNRAIVAHVGDSRVYRFDRKGLICLTEDHSEVGEALRAGLITAEQAARHPRRNVISRALGAEIEVEPDFREIEIDDRTSFMLCSDGVTRHVTDEEIARLMKNGQRPQAICELLKQLCYQGGAEDNLTAIVVDFGARSYAPHTEDATKPRVPARAAQAQAASDEIGGTLRQANKIEVNLKSRESASGKIGSASAGGKQGSAPTSHQAQQGANPLAARQFEPQTESQSGTVQSETSRSQARRFNKPKSRSLMMQGDEPPLEEEMSKLMKMSLLFITLIIGVVSGALLYGYTPLKGIVNNLMGKIDPYEERRIQYRFKDPESSSAFALHLEGRSDEARARINAALAANSSNAEALYYLGRIDLDQKKYDDAVTHLKEAAKQDAKLPDVWAHLATAYLGLGQSRNAMDALLRLSATPSTAPSASPKASPTPAG